MHFFISKKNTREKIKEATFELLCTVGYAQISMRDIAKKAQTAVGQLTYYYGTKENLIGSVVDEILESFTKELKVRMEKSKDKYQEMNDFFEELRKNESDACKIFIDFTAQSLWNSHFRDKMNSFLNKTTDMIQDVYIESGDDVDTANSKAKMHMANFVGLTFQNAITKV